MAYDNPSVTAGELQGWVGTVEHLKQRTRLARQAFWFPLVLLGLVVIASTPLYFQPSEQAQLGLPSNVVFKARPASVPLAPARPGHSSQRVHGHWYGLPACTPVHGVVYFPCESSAHPVAGFSYFPGGYNVESPRAIALYWLIALPLSSLLIGWWYRRRARLRGVATSPAAYVVANLVLVALLVLASPGAVHLLHLPRGLAVPFVADLGLRGLTTLFTVGLGLLVLAYKERSRALGEFAVSFLALALLVNLYDLENFTNRLGIHVGPEVGAFVPGLYLALGGLGFAVTRRRAQ